MQRSLTSCKAGRTGGDAVSWISDALSILGGADLDVLKHAKSERSSFVGLGLVMLGTAAVAALSMTFALNNAVLVIIDANTGGPAADQPVSHLIISSLIGLIWGALILVLDRALIKTMQGVAGVKALLYAIPRVILALVIGIVVSTPLTIQIFSSQIAAQVKQDQDAAIGSIAANAANGPVASELNNVRQQIIAQENILKGQVAGISSPELVAAQAELDAATQGTTDAEAAKKAAYLALVCEEAGAANNPDCSRATNKEGKGPVYRARKHDYNVTVDKLAEAKAKEDDALAKRDKAQREANAANQGLVDKAKVQANIELCGKAKDADGRTLDPPTPDPQCASGLRARAEQLQTTLDSLQDGSLARQQGGLLAQIIALGEISASKASAGSAHWLVAALFMLIELLPVIIKTFIAVRGVTQYDRIAKKLQDDEYESVNTDTEERQRQRDRETRKLEAIRDDMLKREIVLGKTANKHVAGEMETILTHALSDWSKNVHSTLASNPGDPGENQPGTARATDPYGLPDGAQL